MRAKELLVLAAVLTVGCDDEAGIIKVAADVRVRPENLDFGQVRVNSQVVMEVVALNTGETILQIDGAVGDSDVFTVQQVHAVLEPQALTRIPIAFRPPAIGEFRTTLVLSFSDERLRPIEIAVHGVGVESTLIAEPSALHFGNVVVGTEKPLQLQLQNLASIETEVKVSGSDGVRRCTEAVDGIDFCMALEGPIAIGPLGSKVIEIRFLPSVAGLQEGWIELDECAGEACPIMVSIDGTGVERGLACRPESVEFGEVAPATCATSIVTCENVANDPIGLIGWNIVGSDRASFSAPPSTPELLSPGNTIDLPLEFCPEEIGRREAVFEIETDLDSPSIVSIPLAASGGGPEIDVLPVGLDFGSAARGVPARRRVFVSNLGTSRLDLTNVDPDALGTGTFTVVGAIATAQIEPGASLELIVEANAATVGEVLSELVIRSNDRDEGEVRVPLRVDALDLPPCDFDIVPQSLNFGAVGVGRSLLRNFQVRNVGSEDCLVSSVALTPQTSSAFSLPDGEISSRILGAGSSLVVSVDYHPLNRQTDGGEVEVGISNPITPIVRVPLSGAGGDGELVVSPNVVDFGTVAPGCLVDASIITLLNTGALAAEVTAIRLGAESSSAFTLALVPPLPLTLAAGQTSNFQVGFNPATEGAHLGWIEIDAVVNGLPQLLIVTLDGEASVGAVQTDLFTQLGVRDVDILFVVDDSCSMGEEQASLTLNFDAFILFAVTQSVNYQIGVTTTDTFDGFLVEGGRLVPLGGSRAERIVTENTSPSPVVRFQQNANVGIDQNAAIERGLEAAYLALSSPVISTDNAGFLRPDALLSVIFVSDEEDQSLPPVDFYVNFFRSIKGFQNPEMFTASAVVGDPTACVGPGGSAQAGARYIEVANQTGGIFRSICTSDWASALTDLSSTAFGYRSTFALTGRPVAGTLTVTVDGVVVPTSDWSYDAASNRVVFNETPAPGAEVQIEYVVTCN